MTKNFVDSLSEEQLMAMELVYDLNQMLFKDTASKFLMNSPVMSTSGYQNHNYGEQPDAFSYECNGDDWQILFMSKSVFCNENEVSYCEDEAANDPDYEFYGMSYREVVIKVICDELENFSKTTLAFLNILTVGKADCDIVDSIVDMLRHDKKGLYPKFERAVDNW